MQLVSAQYISSFELPVWPRSNYDLQSVTVLIFQAILLSCQNNKSEILSYCRVPRYIFIMNDILDFAL